jgi:hypothetical protein
MSGIEMSLFSVISDVAQASLSVTDLGGGIGSLIQAPGILDGGQLSDWSLNSLVIAQYKDTLGNDVQNAWNEFVNTGRAWALLLGLVVGYLFSKFTSF